MENNLTEYPLRPDQMYNFNIDLQDIFDVFEVKLNNLFADFERKYTVISDIKFELMDVRFFQSMTMTNKIKYSQTWLGNLAIKEEITMTEYMQLMNYITELYDNYPVNN